MVFIGFSMVLFRFVNEIIVFSTVFIGFSLVFYVFFHWFPLVSHWIYWFHYARIGFYTGYSRVSFESRLVLQWVWPGCTALAHSGEGGGSSPEMPQTLQSSKKLQNDCFSKLFRRVPRGGDRPEHWISFVFRCFFSAPALSRSRDLRNVGIPCAHPRWQRSALHSVWRARTVQGKLRKW